MSKINELIDSIEEKIITVILPLMVILVFMATFFRYTKLASWPWAEELSRYLMVWIVFIGVGVGSKTNAHFTVDNFVMGMPKSTHKFFFILRTLIITGFSLFMLNNSINLIMRIQKMGQTTPALQIPTWTMYSAIPIGFLLILVRTLQHAYKELRKPNVDINSDNDMEGMV